MFKEEFALAAKAAAAKSALLKNNPLGYFLLSMLAGAYIGFGVLLTNTLGASLDGAVITKLVTGAAFGIALSLVVMAGGELFTGNNFVMAAGLSRKTVNLSQAAALWVVCWIGNLAGGAVLAIIYQYSGLGANTGTFIATAAAAKMSAGAMALIMRGILCNILVCLAVWCGFKTKSDSAKLIMIFWCLFAFVASGFEHSIANMTLFFVALMNPSGQAVNIGGMCYNLILVTIGNMIGGIVFVAMPYHFASKE